MRDPFFTQNPTGSKGLFSSSEVMPSAYQLYIDLSLLVLEAELLYHQPLRTYKESLSNWATGTYPGQTLATFYARYSSEAAGASRILAISLDGNR